MIENPAFVYEVVALLSLAALAINIYGLALTGPLFQVLRVPRERLLPVVFVLYAVRSFAIAGRVFDVWVMMAFGLVGFVLRQMNYPIAPLVLGLVLGTILDQNLRRGLVISSGSFEPFFMRPISAVLAFVTIASILWVFVNGFCSKRDASKMGSSQ